MPAPETNFKINIMIENVEHETEEIEELSFIRCPLKKMASFGLLVIELPIVVVHALNELFDTKILPDIKISISTIHLDKRQKKANRHFIPQKLIINKVFKAVSMNTSVIDIDRELQYVTFLLSNNVILYLSNVNSFNQMLFETTAAGALGAFESHITSQHPDVFKFRKVNAQIKSNGHVYEQILAKSRHDLLIPNLLIYNYKMISSFCFYFFDDFSLEETNNMDVECILINLTQVKKFKRRNIFDSHLHRAALKATTTLGNPLNPLFHSDQFHPVISDMQTRFYHKKVPGALVSVPRRGTKWKPETLLSEKLRHYYAVTTGNSAHPVPKHGKREIYSPDGICSGQGRYVSLASQLNKEYLNVIEIVCPRTLPTEVQFGYVYNLDAHFDDLRASSRYNYTPVAIVNTFKKESSKKTETIHTVRAQFLKFVNE